MCKPSGRQFEGGMTRFLPPAYVVQRKGNVLTRVCPSVCPQGERGYPKVPTPLPGQDGGEGYPKVLTPQPGQDVGRATPRYLPPLPGQDRGRGPPNYLPHRPGQDRGREYPKVPTPTPWRAVCLLRSRRRTFLGFFCHQMEESLGKRSTRRAKICEHICSTSILSENKKITDRQLELDQVTQNKRTDAMMIK